MRSEGGECAERDFEPCLVDNPKGFKKRNKTVADKTIQRKITDALSIAELKAAMDEWSNGELKDITDDLPFLTYDEARRDVKEVLKVFDQAANKLEALESFEWTEDVKEGK